MLTKKAKSEKLRVIMGIHGIEKVIELKLKDEEKAALDSSAQDVKKTCDEVDKILAESK